MPMALLIEPDRTNRKLLRDILEIRFSVLESPSAEGALELLRLHQFDLIVLEMKLPGMSGLHLIRRLRATDGVGDLPIVAISADALPDHIREGLRSGCTAYLTKPVLDDPYLLVERILRMLPPFSAN